jgi:hypothetical protein
MDIKVNERAELDALLKRLYDLFGFRPVSIAHEDKPDFRIAIHDRIIGVETTRSNCEEQARAHKLQASVFPSSWANLTDLRDKQRRRSSEEIIASACKHPTDPTIPWKKVSEAMLDWAKSIGAILTRKRLKYNKPEFQTFDENWLLIHHYPPSQVDVFTQPLAQELLKEIFNSPEEVDRDFDAIFVHSDDYLFCWHEQELSVWLNKTRVG